jgi:DNA-directed RNA polymerase subunit RPC12/RpoP
MNVAALHLTYLDAGLKPKCPACSSYQVKVQILRGAHSVGDQVYECFRCGAVFGTFARFEDSYQHVDGKWCGCQIPKGAPDVEQRYFDFTGLTPPEGRQRRHGWYHPACKQLTQIG